MGILVIALSINPRPLSALELKLSGLTMESRVDTADDNQNTHVIISNYDLISWLSDFAVHLYSHLINEHASFMFSCFFSSIVQIIFFFLSFGISECIWSISNILFVKNHLLNCILIIWPLWDYESLI